MSSVSVVLFSLVCTPECHQPVEQLASIEKRVERHLLATKMELRRPEPGVDRPTGSSAPLEPTDVAAAHLADFVVALDFESASSLLWVTLFQRGSKGPRRVARVRCFVRTGSMVCPKLASVLRLDFMPRQRDEVDILPTLRSLAPRVGVCVRQEDRVPISERIFGRVDVDLVIPVSGRVEVSSIAPARVARARLGGCLRKVFESVSVGRFVGKPIRLTVPVDL